ncbi:hypothetical protein QS257_08420 [Terrilactibacillus sp. S3-3]|nr:hypothetical protein QS257_08420 [Terrilactibacillus sp. S3-3]
MSKPLEQGILLLLLTSFCRFSSGETRQLGIKAETDGGMTACSL